MRLFGRAERGFDSLIRVMRSQKHNHNSTADNNYSENNEVTIFTDTCA